MDKKERINEAFNYLVYKQIVKSKSDVASQMHSSKASTINALNGNENYLTDNFIKKFCLTFSGIFNVDWILSGNGEMLQNKDHIIAHNVINSGHHIVSGNGSTINESQQYSADYVKQLEQENKYLKEQNTTLLNIIANGK